MDIQDLKPRKGNEFASFLNVTPRYINVLYYPSTAACAAANGN